MPIIHIHLLEGREPAKRHRLGAHEPRRQQPQPCKHPLHNTRLPIMVHIVPVTSRCAVMMSRRRLFAVATT